MCRVVLKVSAFKVATQEIDLEPFGGEGKLKVRGINTKVTMICLPDFPTADQVYIADVITG